MNNSNKSMPTMSSIIHIFVKKDTDGVLSVYFKKDKQSTVKKFLEMTWAGAIKGNIEKRNNLEYFCLVFNYTVNGIRKQILDATVQFEFDDLVTIFLENVEKINVNTRLQNYLKMCNEKLLGTSSGVICINTLINTTIRGNADKANIDESSEVDRNIILAFLAQSTIFEWRYDKDYHTDVPFADVNITDRTVRLNYKNKGDEEHANVLFIDYKYHLTVEPSDGLLKEMLETVVETEDRAEIIRQDNKDKAELKKEGTRSANKSKQAKDAEKKEFARHAMECEKIKAELERKKQQLKKAKAKAKAVVV